MAKAKLLPKEPNFIDKLQAERELLQNQLASTKVLLSLQDRKDKGERLREVKRMITRFLLDLNADGITIQ